MSHTKILEEKTIGWIDSDFTFGEGIKSGKVSQLRRTLLSLNTAGAVPKKGPCLFSFFFFFIYLFQDASCRRALRVLAHCPLFRATTLHSVDSTAMTGITASGESKKRIYFLLMP
jgi:hypothetical protein